MKRSTIRPTPNRATIQHLVSQLEMRTRQHFAAARADVAPVLRAFADAYGRELQRLRQQALDEDGEDADTTHIRVPLHWLITSGWQARVQHAMQHAAHTAAQGSLADLKHAQRQAIQDGTDEAQRLMRQALAPGIRLMRQQRGRR